MFSNVVNPLALPKGLKLSCELCGKAAHVQCSDCRVTYYCGRTHQSLDFDGIHEKICHLLVPLRTPVAVLGSEEERIQRDKETRVRQRKLLEISKTEAHKKLFEAKFDLALPPALSALRFSMLVYGPDAVELVPAYLLLGEASIGLKQYAQAEEYLSLAKWSVLKSPGCENSVRAQLHRNFGLLYASQGRFDEAVKQLAHDIYFSSLSYGPEHLSVAGGYYQLGNIFQKIDKMTECVACFDKVVEIWKTFLKTPNAPLDGAKEAEGVTTLNAIQRFRSSRDSSKTLAAECSYVLAQLYHRAGKAEQAREHGMLALEAYESTLGREHTLTHETRAFVKNIVNEIQSRSPGRRASIQGSLSTYRGRNSSSHQTGGFTQKDRSNSIGGSQERVSGVATLGSNSATGTTEDILAESLRTASFNARDGLSSVERRRISSGNFPQDMLNASNGGILHMLRTSEDASANPQSLSASFNANRSGNTPNKDNGNLKSSEPRRSTGALKEGETPRPASRLSEVVAAETTSEQ